MTALRQKTDGEFVCCCEPGWETTVAKELAGVFPGTRPRIGTPGWLSISDWRGETASDPTIALASQCLPRAAEVNAGSIREWIQTVGLKIIDLLADHDGPWRLHVFALSGPGALVGSRRASLIKSGIVELLRKRQRRLLRSRRIEDGLFAKNEALAQVGLITPNAGFLSVSLPAELHRLRRCVAPFSGGVVEVAPDRKAPSRAFAKLLEAELRLGRRIELDDVCVDLGSSPGSWAYVALSRGASVTAIDRSPLRPDLMKNSRLKFVRGDAFRFAPESPVDWLLCDVIAPPERTMDLLRRWLDERWCRRFCVTIKFRGAGDYIKLEAAKQWLAESGAEFLMRRLTNNKNEVTVAGEVPCS